MKWAFGSLILLSSPLLSLNQVAPASSDKPISSAYPPSIWKGFTLTSYDRRIFPNWDNWDFDMTNYPPVTARFHMAQQNDHNSKMLRMQFRFIFKGEQSYYRNIQLEFDDGSTPQNLKDNAIKNRIHLSPYKQSFQMGGVKIILHKLPNNGHIRFQLYAKVEGKTIATINCDLNLNKLIDRESIIGNYENGKYTNSQIVYNNAFSLPPRTKISKDARPVFEIKDPSLLDKFDFFINKRGSEKEVFLKKIIRENAPNLYMFTNYDFAGDQEYHLDLKPKEGFFSEFQAQHNKIRFKFKTKAQTEESGIAKPEIRERGWPKFEKATTSTTLDSKITIELKSAKHANDFRLFYKLANQGKETNLKMKKSMEAHQWIADKLPSDQEITIYASLMNPSVTDNDRGQVWEDGFTNDVEIGTWSTLRQDYIGLTKPTVQVKEKELPTSRDLSDGKMDLIIDIPPDEKKRIEWNFRSSLNQQTKTKWDLIDESSSLYRFSNLANDEKITFEFIIKDKRTSTNPSGDTWTDGTTKKYNLPEEFSAGETNVILVDIPKLSSLEHLSIIPRTTTSRDGTLVLEFIEDEARFNDQEIRMWFQGQSDDTKIELLPHRNKQNNKWMLRMENLIANSPYTVYASLKNPRQPNSNEGSVWRGAYNVEFIQIIIDSLRQSYPGLKRPDVTLINKKLPTTKTARDGYIDLEIVDFQPEKMDLEISSSLGSTRESVIEYEPVSGSPNLYRFSNLANAERIQITITLKKIRTDEGEGDLWTDGSSKPILSTQYDVGETNVEGIATPVVEIRDQKAAKTKTSKTGELILQFSDFVFRKIDVSIESPSAHQENWINVDQVKITSLGSNQEIKVYAQPKEGSLWVTTESGQDPTSKKLLDTFTTELVDYEGLIKNAEVIENPEKDQDPKIIDSQDGIKWLGFKSTQSYQEIKKLWENTEKRFEAPNSLPQLVSEQLDEDWGFKVQNLANGVKLRLFLTPKPGHYWNDGTNDEVSLGEFDAPSTSKKGTQQPAVDESQLKPGFAPTTKSSSDGVWRIKLEGFDPVKMRFESSRGITNYDSDFKTIEISELGAEQVVSFVISPRDDYSWFAGEDVSGQFQMVQIIGFPNNPLVTKEDPTELGGFGYVIIPGFEPPEGATLQYQSSLHNEWTDADPNGTRLRGQNGFQVRFRWQLKSGDPVFKWVNRALVAPPPPPVQLKNPGVVVEPKVNVVVQPISKPKGRGTITIEAFSNPEGATLRYQTSETPDQWQDVDPNGQKWEKANNFNIRFKWELEKKFVWERAHPKDFANREVTLQDPEDNLSPRWSIVVGNRDISPIQQLEEDKFVVTVKDLYGNTVLTEDLFSYFAATDHYGVETLEKPEVPTEVQFDGTARFFTLKAHDLAGNTSQLRIELATKYRIIDLQNVQERILEVKKSFSGHGEIATRRLSNDFGTIPLFRFQNQELEPISMHTKKVFARYRVVNKNGEPVKWKDRFGNAYDDWSSEDRASPHPFGSFYPDGFSNSDVIEVQFSPHDGYRISNPRVFKFAVSGLIEEIKTAMIEPGYVFRGDDGAGSFDFEIETSDESDKLNYLVQVLRPYTPPGLSKGKVVVDAAGVAIYGIELFVPSEDQTDINDPNNWQLVTGIDLAFIERLSQRSHWQNDEIRKVWKSRPLSDKINDPNDLAIKKTLMSRQKINFLANFYWIRALPQAKVGYGFKWVGSENPKLVRLQPQSFVKEINWDNDNPLANLEQVTGLSIKPPVDLSSDDFEIMFLPALDKAYKYEGDLRVVPSYIPNPDNGDRFRWKYQLVDSTDKLVSNWLETPDISRIKNGFKLVVAYEAIAPYTLSEPYASMKRAFPINNLKRKIDISTIPRPTIVFRGFIGKGTIANLVEHEIDKQAYARNGDGLPQPRISDEDRGSVKWQYRVFASDPTSLPAVELATIPWDDNVPQELIPNHYVQMRIAPTNAARDGVEPQIYAIDPKTNQAFVQVHGLEINVARLEGHSFEILGNRHQNIIAMVGVDDDSEIKANSEMLVFEAWSEKQEAWLPLVAFKNKLKNGMKLSFRAYSKNPYLAHLPSPSQNENVVIIAGKRYLQFESWKEVPIKGLKTTIYLRDLRILNHQFMAMKATPWDNFPNAKQGRDVVSGWAQLSGGVFDSEDLNAAFYVDESGTSFPARDKIEVQYQLLKFNPQTNGMLAQGWSPFSPTNLANGDEIQIRLVASDQQNFELDWVRETTLKVANLLEPDLASVTGLPTLVFSGPDGLGIATLTKSPPKLYEYGYQVYDASANLISDWTKTFPAALSNGFYVKTRVIARGDDLQNPQKSHIDSELTIVDGLVTRQHNLANIDLASLTKAKVRGRINYKATLAFNQKIITTLEARSFRVEFLVKSRLNTSPKRFVSVPHNLANGDHLTIEIVNTKSGKKHNLQELKKDFYGIRVNGLVDEEAHSKTLSKAIWIPIVVFVFGLLVGLPVYAIRRKKKLAI